MLRLKELREMKGVTQLEFSRDIGVAASTAGMWEQGRREPDAETLKSIAQYFNVSTDYLLGNDPPSYYHDPETALLAQEAHDNPDLRILFDASRKLSPKDLQTVTNLVKSLTGEE